MHQSTDDQFCLINAYFFCDVLTLFSQRRLCRLVCYAFHLMFRSNAQTGIIALLVLLNGRAGLQNNVTAKMAQIFFRWYNVCERQRGIERARYDCISKEIVSPGAHTTRHCNLTKFVIEILHDSSRRVNKTY